MESTRCDFVATLQRLGGDEQLFRELATYFMEDAEELLKVIHHGLATGRAEDVERAVHSLRGLAANFDAKRVISIAGSIEQMAAQGELHTVLASFADLESEVQSLRRILKAYALPTAAAGRDRD